jgi:hypothetical protein
MGSGMFFHVFQAAEEFQRSLDIESNLPGQKFGRIKSPFFPDAMQKLQSRGPGRWNGVPQHKGFDSGCVLVKRRTHTDV